MNIILIFLIIGALFAAQLLLCLRTVRRFVRFLPVIVTVAAMIACTVLYYFTANWAWLIFILLMFYALVSLVAAWLVFAAICLINKAVKRRKM